MTLDFIVRFICFPRYLTAPFSCPLRPLTYRVSKGPDAGAWYNEFFLRGSPEEMKNMLRVKIKGNRPGPLLEEVEDPNFYSMPPLPTQTSSPMITRLLRECKPGPVPSRRVSVDMPPAEMAAHAGPAQLFPEPALSRRTSSSSRSSNSTPDNDLLSMELNMLNKRQRSLPSTVSLYNQMPFMPPRFDYQATSSTVFSHCPFYGNKSNAHQMSEANPRPFIDHALCQTIDNVSSSAAVTQDEESNKKMAATAGLEPLPFNDADNHSDDFASFIDSTIQIV